MFASTPSKHRWFAIRLPRPLWIGLMAVLLTAVAIGLHFGLPIYHRLKAIREIERLGGRIETTKGWPPWLRRWCGDKAMRYFDSDRTVLLGNTALGDADVWCLEHLRGVEHLELYDTRLTDAGLAQLDQFNGLRNLMVLDLRNVALSDVSLTHLGKLSNLESINLGSVMLGSEWPAGRMISDTGIVHLRGLSKLKNLDLNGTMVTDKGLTSVSALTNLTHLWLASTSVTDAGMTHLTGLTRLEVLCLRNTRVTSQGMGQVKRAILKVEFIE